MMQWFNDVMVQWFNDKNLPGGVLKIQFWKNAIHWFSRVYDMI